jgi:hypothetical protein
MLFDSPFPLAHKQSERMHTQLFELKGLNGFPLRESIHGVPVISITLNREIGTVELR